MTANPSRVARLTRFGLTTADAESAAKFYEAAFGCRRIATERLGGPGFERLMGATGGADRITLNLGREIIELMQFDFPGEPYPRALPSSDLVFQHFAIVVADMTRAFQRLSAIAGWTPISTGGPERLPASSGGVIAFKFRDPEGHPLELLAFPGDARSNWPGVSPEEICLGIDHSAISVSDSAASIAFYQNLGLSVSARSFNHGCEQQRLDDVPTPRLMSRRSRRAAPPPISSCYATVGLSNAPHQFEEATISPVRILFSSFASAPTR